MLKTMKFFILGILVLLSSLNNSNCQTNDLKKNFDLGSQAFANKRFAEADSLFSLCVSKSINGDIFFNRAQARRYLSDTCGYCRDLKAASDFFGDREAESQYINNCLIFNDTTFYSKDYEKISRNARYRYYHILRRQVCDTFTYVTYHDIKKKRLVYSMNIQNLSTAFQPLSKSTDIVGQAYIQDTTRYFYYINGVSSGDIFENDYDKIRDFTLEMGKKYNELKEFKKDLLHISLKLYLNKEGKIVNMKILESELNTKNITSNKNIGSDLSDFFKNDIIPYPVKFQNQNVFYEFYYTFDF